MGAQPRVIGKVLIDKYQDLAETGWNVNQPEIERDIRLLLRDNFLNFLKG